MNTYPTSAELATFRRSIEPNRPPYGPDNQWTGPGYDDSQTVESGHRWYSWPGGAWPDELRHGIGYRDGRTYSEGARITLYHGSIARRKASAMRSRAYAARPLAVRYCTPYDCTHRAHYRPTIDGPSWV